MQNPTYQEQRSCWPSGLSARVSDRCYPRGFVAYGPCVARPEVNWHWSTEPSRPAALAGRIAAVRIGSGWINVLARSSLDGAGRQ